MPEQDEGAGSAEAEGEGEERGGRSFWSGTLTFGLVSIPVDLFSANRSTRPRLRMLTSEGAPLHRAYFDAKEDRELDAKELVRGYRLEDDRFVTVTDEELESILPELSRDIHLRRFVGRDAIPPAYFRRSYYLAPSGQSTRAYAVLAQTMEKTGHAGLATFVMRGKAYVIVITAKKGILQAETLRFADELRSPEDVGLPTRTVGDETKTTAIEKALRKLEAKSLDLEWLRDERAAALEALAAKKRQQGKDVVEAPDAAGDAEGEEWGPTDLMALLKERLRSGASEPPKAKKAVAPKRAPAKEKVVRSTTKKAAGKSSKKSAKSSVRRAAR